MTENIIYFAYGSNMLSRHLRGRTPSADILGTGYIVGRRLTFDKVSTDGSGKCDIAETGNQDDRVYGVLYEIKASEKSISDEAEGLDKGYKEEQVEVVTLSCNHQAIAYVATKKEPALRPYHWYKAIVIAGAVEHRLPDPYVEWIRTVDSKSDPKIERRAKNEKLLFDS